MSDDDSSNRVVGTNGATAPRQGKRGRPRKHDASQARPILLPLATAKQVGIRLPAPVVARVEATAKALGLDVSNLLRMVIIEHLHEYERRVPWPTCRPSGGRPSLVVFKGLAEAVRSDLGGER